MKKLVSVMAIVLICALTLCACTPNEKELKTRYIRNEYNISLITAKDLIDRGVELNKIKYQFVAHKGAIVAHVVAFKDGDSAKKCYENVSDFSKKTYEVLGYVAKRKGNAVVWGTEEAVKIF